jgi:putative membrane protein
MVLQQWSSFVNFLTYLVVSIPLLLIGIKIFMLQTPYDEMKMIQDAACCDKTAKDEAGIAIAHDLGGKIVGQALVMASAVFHSVSVGDLIIWGIIGIIFQVLVYYVFEKLTPFKVTEELVKGNIAVGIFSSRLSFATGLILAALIS